MNQSLTGNHGLHPGHISPDVCRLNARYVPSIDIQWNPSCEANPFAPEKWPFKRGVLWSVVEINTFMFRFTLSRGLSRGGGFSSGWPLKRGSTVLPNFEFILICF